MTPFIQYKPWMIERYGDALFRVPVQLASSCPHGRCAFCPETGARAQQTQRQESPLEQIEAAIHFSKRRYKAQKLMLYIQAFTADLTHPAQQKQILQCLETHPFEAISIGARPDGLPPEALDFLESLKNITPTPLKVWNELGVQTSNDQTLEKMNRGHNWARSKKAILDLAERGILVAPHVIIGLPGETSADWNRTAEELAKLPIAGIKIHNLHIIQGAALAKNPPPTLSHWEYAEALMNFLRRIPSTIPVMRISTDTPDDQLIAPRWPLEKGQFLDYVIQQMTLREITQGDLQNKNDAHPPFLPVVTEDKSITFFSTDWKEHYHTKSGARLEAQKKFVEPSGLAAKLETSNINLLDVCFGLGYNSLAALQSRTGFQPVLHHLDITALEMDKRVVRAASEQIEPLQTDSVDWKKALHQLLEHSTFHLPHARLSLLFGDARYLIQTLEDNRFDMVFHDPFSSQRCPELWTVEIFQQLYRVMKLDGILLTYSSSFPVRGAMREAGFFVGETHPGHPMGNGTIAAKRPETLPVPMLGTFDQRRSVPYRDPHLCATSKSILRQRQEAVEASG